MYYYYYKRKNPDDILVYIEEYDKQTGYVLFDFIDSNEFYLFADLININPDFSKPTMMLLEKYNKRTIRENTIYSIKPEVIQSWREQLSIAPESLDSFLIGYSINASEIEGEIFSTAVSLNDFFDFELNYYMHGWGDISKIPLPAFDRVTVTIRNVGQGSWNEISCNDEVKIVYDAGAPMHASMSEVRGIIGNRNVLYSNKPILILSHWDKDHYHSLLGMSDTELQDNFSAFICRDRIPNITSRILFGRLRNAVGASNTYTINADMRSARGGPTFLRNITPINGQFVLYNSQYHKDRNISGLLLTVKSANNSIVLPGDAHYEQISRDILPHLNYEHKHYLVVPLHGGKAGAYIYSRPSSMVFKDAIISVGTNSYGHPNNLYVNALRTDFSRVRQTRLERSDIIVTL